MFDENLIFADEDVVVDLISNNTRYILFDDAYDFSLPATAPLKLLSAALLMDMMSHLSIETFLSQRI